MNHEKDPIKTANFVNAGKFISELLSSNGMGAIIGEKGSGKTFIKRKIIGAFEEKKSEFRVIEIVPMGEQVQNIGQIMNSMISDISGEAPRQDNEARRRQLRRILGETKENVVLAIDEAQDLHHSTLRGLKKLHELGFGTRDQLFTIILFGQNSLKDRISDDELRPRIRRYCMRDLTQKEKELFISETKKFTPGAFEIFLKRTRKTPLAVEDAYRELMQITSDLDMAKIDDKIVSEYFSFDVRDMILRFGKSYRELSKAITEATDENVSPTTLNQIVNGKYNGDIERIGALIEKTEKSNPKKERGIA